MPTLFEDALETEKLKGPALFEKYVESFQKDVHGGRDHTEGTVNEAAAAELFDADDPNEGLLEQAFHRGLIEEKDIDFDLLMRTMPDVAFKQIEDGKKLDEAAVDALVGSEWQRLFRPCVQYVFRDRTCPQAPLGQMASCYPEPETIPCWDYESTVKICEWKRTPPPEACCWPHEGGLDPKPKFHKVGQYKCYQLGKPCTRDFAFAFHRSLACVDPNGEARRQVDDHLSFWRDYIFEHERIDHIFGIQNCDPSSSCGSAVDHRFWYNDVKYESAYQTPEDAGPWINSITDPNLVLTNCNLSILRCTLTDIFERMRDPCNCFPIDCGGPLNVIVANGCQANAWRELQSTNSLLRKLTDGCSDVEVKQNFINDGFGDDVKQSRWIWDKLVNYYLNCYSEEYTPPGGAPETVGPANRIVDAVVAQQTAEYWAANTYILHKNIQDAVDFNIQFEETRTIGGTDHDMYFSEGITLAERHIFSYLHSWRRPELVLRIRGFDPTVDIDGNAIPGE